MSEQPSVFGSNTHSQVLLPTSLPWFWRNSTSCWEKVVMEIDLTLWGGLSPLSIPEHDVQTKLPTVMSV